MEELEKRLFIRGLTMAIEPLIWNSESLGFVYRIIDHDFTECATLVLTNAIDYCVHEHEEPVLHIRELFVKEEHRRRGIARLLLFYALCHAMEQSPEIRYSDLEDNTDIPVDEPGNLYYWFGYRFKEGDKQEKWLDLDVFKKNRSYLLPYVQISQYNI